VALSLRIRLNALQFAPFIKIVDIIGVGALPWRERAGDGRQQLEFLGQGRATEPERGLPGVAPRCCTGGRNDGVVIGLNVVLWRVEVDETRRVSAPQKT
jgi:hypothetical protein